MSGTGPTPAEQHLGDRLAALVDGELEHDARDRVLAHLATCPRCKAEADAQRRLKNVFAQSAPPPLSEGLLARLQGLPAAPAAGDDDEPGPFGGGRVAGGVFGGLNPSAGRPRDPRAETFGYVPGGAHAAVLPGGGSGFRIHEVGRAEAERSPWRGRRFAFAAASAVSFAAIALGGAVPLDVLSDSGSRGQGGGNKVTPLRTTTPTTATNGSGTGSSGGATSLRGTEGERRRGTGSGQVRPGSGPVVAAVPGEPAGQTLNRSFGVSPLNHASAMSPLIRPTASVLRLAAAPAIGPAATPVPTHLAAPTQPAPPLPPSR
ncbi:anti-sigma factor family protein [Streptomyces peucetius]|uniref:Zf-HC2 domain-containing protein n=1 Tax=Streptomyces peucetius TaxID=1950 RepID=A0ABY6IDG7_STRPE|nr:zf-HC2 domain-containing protein [Streptomyces peucetius]UYQ64230.1 zf-HC2 domain-containing protein [Streptomyces peucetius]